MSEAEVLLGKIAALRQRLEQARGLADDANSTAAVLAARGQGNRLPLLERQVAEGGELGQWLDGSLRQHTDAAATEREPLPRLLTARARRLLETARALLAQLRNLADVFDTAAAEDPLAGLYRDCAAMTDTAVRAVQALPDSASAQLQMCRGLEATLEVVRERLDSVSAVVARRRRELDRVELLAHLLGELHAGKAVGLRSFTELAEALLAEATDAIPVRFLAMDQPGLRVASHSLTVAQVMARLVRQDPELRARPLEPVLVCLVHDAGMLGVPEEILTHPGPLDPDARRVVEAHAHAGAELAARLLPDGGWLAETVATHHERLDGTGYPGGLRDLQITPLARLLAVCDVYAALCCPRPYRQALDTRTALTDTLLLAESGVLDRFHAERLLHLSFYPVGTVIELADGSVGAVVATHSGRRDLNLPARPVVALLTDPHGSPLPAPEHVDLAQCEGRSIVRSVPWTERRQRLGRRYPEWAA